MGYLVPDAIAAIHDRLARLEAAIKPDALKAARAERDEAWQRWSRMLGTLNEAVLARDAALARVKELEAARDTAAHSRDQFRQWHGEASVQLRAAHAREAAARAALDGREVTK